MSKILNQIQAAKRLLADNQVSVYYDHYIAPLLWDDFKDQYSGYMHVFQSHNRADYILFGDLERPQFKASDLEAMSEYDLGELHGDVIDRWQGDMTKAELIEELMEVTTLDFYTTVYANSTWRDLDYTYTLMGYSQGDAVKVLELDTMPKEMPAPSKDLLHNLLFDSPIRGTIRFKGESYELEVLLDNPYKYDKAQVLNRAAYAFSDHEDIEGLIEFLTVMLPTVPQQ